MLLQVFLLVLAIVMLYYGAELALESAEKIGLYFGLSPLVIGLVIVGFGTSLPEFFVSQLATYRGESGIALGNIVGSNIANLFLILGASGLFETLYIQRQEIKIQFILHLVLTVLLTIVLFQAKLYIWCSLLLLGFFSFYMWDTFKQMSKQRHLTHFDSHDEKVQLHAMDFVKLLAGFVLLYGGGEVLVSSGTEIGKIAGISPYVISAVFVAFGTSFPELVTALLACYRKKNTDIITGNIIGSNIFNVSFVLMSLGVYDVSIDQSFNVEIGVLMFASVFLLALVYMKKNFARLSGAIFLSLYIGVVYYWATNAPV